MSNPREFSRPTTFSIALFLACLLLTGMASGTPSIKLSKKSGPPTSKILVSGRGFAPNVGVDVYFDAKDEALIVTNGQGQFEDVGIHAPGSSSPGRHWVTALERDNDKGAQEPFLVRTNWRQFHRLDMMRFNRFENVLSPKTVKNLRLKWRYKEGDSVPVVADGVVYVGSSDGIVYALNDRTGTLLWSHSIGGSVDNSPAVVKGIVYVTLGDTVYALNARTGGELWHYTAGGYLGYSAPTVVEGTIFIGSEDYNLYALDARTGTKRWGYATPDIVYSSPAVVNGVVYFSSFDDTVYALDADTGTELWSYNLGSDVTSSPAIANGLVYAGDGDGNIDALDATTGVPVWSHTVRGSVWSSPAVADGVVYIGSESYYLYALDASTGAELWEYPTDFYVESSPAVANGVVYVSSRGQTLYALDAVTGVKLWSDTDHLYPYLSPIIVNGMVYVGTSDGICAFGLPHSDEASERSALKSFRPDLTLKVSKR
jgi:outer membrane protein assembly factor BamB